MSASRFLFGFILSPALLVAQLTNNTVTATASGSASATPDQASISITVTSGANATLEQIVDTLSGVGVTAANLTNVGLFNQWDFALTIPIAQLENTTAALTAIVKSISANDSGLSLSFNVSGTQFSGQPSSNCTFATLLAQARTQAQQIAGAVGQQIGAITGLSAATSSCALTATFAIPSPFAQPGPNTVTIAASGTNTPQNDQATVSLNVSSPVTADLNDVTNALAASGITGATLSSVFAYPPSPLEWTFNLIVPLSKLTATIAQIASAEQSFANQNAGWTIQFEDAVPSASQAQQASTCSQAALVSSAQTLAQQIATAAGVSVGEVLNLLQGGSATTGGFVTFGGLSDVILASAPCSLTVQYQLL